MTAIAGVIDPDHPLFDTRLLCNLLKDLSAFGRDDQQAVTWEGGHFLRVLLRITPEDLQDRQPLIHVASGLLLLFDGRLDNRSALAEQLGIGALERKGLADSDLALHAVLRWGKHAPRYLVGAFAMACWQPASRQLWLARDQLGQRPLYWARHGKRIAFASSARALLGWTGHSPAIDEARLHDWLCHLPDAGRQSFFVGVSRVEPGCVVEFVDAELRSSNRYELLEETPELRLARDDDYVEALDELMTQIIRDQLRSAYPVSSHLSSGLDSTMVACYAARALASAGQRLAAYTAVPRPGYQDHLQGRHADESPLAAQVAQQLGNVDHHRVSIHQHDWLSVIQRASASLDMPVLNPHNFLWIDEIYRRAASSGSRVMLTGQLGNLTSSYSGSGVLGYLLRTRQWHALVQEIKALQRQGHELSAVLRGLFRGLVPVDVRVAVRTALKRGGPDSLPNTTVTPRLLALYRSRRLAAHGHQSLPRGGRLGYNPERVLALTRRDFSAHFFHANQVGLELRDPTADIRLVRFCLSLPESQFFRQGQSRWLARRLLAGRVPDDVVTGSTRGLQSADIAEHMRDSAERTMALVRIMQSDSELASCLNIDQLLALAESGRQAASAPRHESYAQEYMRSMRLARGVATGMFITSVREVIA